MGTEERIALSTVERWKLEELPAWGKGEYSPDEEQIAEMIREGIEQYAQERQPSDMERFGRFVFEVMDGSEWNSETFQQIGDYAAFVLGITFSEPGEGDWE